MSGAEARAAGLAEEAAMHSANYDIAQQRWGGHTS